MSEIKRYDLCYDRMIDHDRWIESLDGEWVRWEDVKHLIQPTAEDSSVVVPKHFHVFIGEDYYPGCGLRDYRGSYETLAQALEHARKMKYVAFVSEVDAGYACVLESTREGLKIRLAKGYGYGDFFGEEGPPDGCLVEDESE